MFTILVPVSLAPLVFTLFWAERKARSLGLVEKALAKPGEPAPARTTASGIALIWHWMETFDLIGLVFLETAVALILVPLTLSSTENHGWHNGMVCVHIMHATYSRARHMSFQARSSPCSLWASVFCSSSRRGRSGVLGDPLYLFGSSRTVRS